MAKGHRWPCSRSSRVAESAEGVRRFPRRGQVRHAEEKDSFAVQFKRASAVRLDTRNMLAGDGQIPHQDRLVRMWGLRARSLRKRQRPCGPCLARRG